MKVSDKEIDDAIESASYMLTDDRDTLDAMYRDCIRELITGKENVYSRGVKEKVRLILLQNVELEF